MYAVIASPCFWKDIEQVVKTMGEEILFTKIDKDIDFLNELEMVSRIAIKYLIIDISAAADLNRLLMAIMNYKIKRESTRIIIIAPNCLPGNQLLSQLFSIGIYDIINPQGEQEQEFTIYNDLIECLSREKSYAKGIKFFTGPQDTNIVNTTTKEKTKFEKDTPERTVVIEKGKILGTVVIAVAGTMKRIGTTHTVISLTKFLKDLNYNVAAVELIDSKNFTAIKSSYEDIKIEADMFTLDGMDFYPYSKDLSVLDILQEEYNYLILDMGVYNEENFNNEEFKRANERIIVSGVKDWELTGLENILTNGDKIYKNKYYFTFAEKSTFDMVVSNMDKLQCYHAPYSPEPFKSYKENVIIFKDMLKEILPDVKKTQQGIKTSFLNIFSGRLGDKKIET